MCECLNCNCDFSEPIYIDDEPRCPHCMSGNVIVGDEDDE